MKKNSGRYRGLGGRSPDGLLRSRRYLWGDEKAMVSWWLLLVVVVADAGPLEGFYIDVFLQKVLVFGKSMNKFWWWMEAKDVIFGRKHPRFVNVSMADEQPCNYWRLHVQYGHFIPIFKVFLNGFCQGCPAIPMWEWLKGYHHPCNKPICGEGHLASAFELIKNEVVLFKIRSQEHKTVISISGFQRDVVFRVSCHLSSGPLPDISRVMTPGNYRGYNPSYPL